MKQVNDRYEGPITTIYSYTNECLVKCPSCQRPAIVTVANSYSTAKLTCNYCNYSETAADRIRYKVSVRDNCDNCGKLISKVIPHSKKPVDGFAISCSACEETRIYRATNEEYTRPYNYGADPVFHLPLWLQETVRGNLFWAYNRRHLHDIKQYVTAKLRERQDIKYTTMVETLPNFIKAAKNREAMLKAIEKLERK
ncbi:MAG: hypothetical protein ACRYFX_17610 [Janthinobacterium lividum]